MNIHMEDRSICVETSDLLGYFKGSWGLNNVNQNLIF